MRKTNYFVHIRVRKQRQNAIRECEIVQRVLLYFFGGMILRQKRGGGGGGLFFFVVTQLGGLGWVRDQSRGDHGTGMGWSKERVVLRLLRSSYHPAAIPQTSQVCTVAARISGGRRLFCASPRGGGTFGWNRVWDLAGKTAERDSCT